MRGLAVGLVGPATPELGDGKARHASLGLGAAACRALVADLATSAGRGTREGRDRGRVVVRLDLHQHMLQGFLLAVSRAGLAASAGDEALDAVALHHRGVVRIGHHGVLGRQLVRVADHREQALVLRHAVDRELGVEDLVAAMLAVGLGEHHEFDVGRVAAQVLERLDQVVDLVVGQRQAPGPVGFFQRLAAGLGAGADDVDMLHRRWLELAEQRERLFAAGDGALGHAVVQQRGDLAQLLGAQRALGQQAGLERQAVFGDALDPLDREAAVASDVGRLGRPGRDGTDARRHHDQGASGFALVGLAVGQQGLPLLELLGRQRHQRVDQVHETGRNAADLVADGLQSGQELLGAEVAEGVAAFDRGDVLGHGVACSGRKTRNFTAPREAPAIRAPHPATRAATRAGSRPWPAVPASARH